MSTRSSEGSSAIRAQPLVDRLLETALRRFVKRASLTVTTSSGHRFTAGEGGEPSVSVRFADAAAEWALLMDPELQLGELFMEERLIVENGSIFDFLQAVLQDSDGDRSALPFRTLTRFRNLARRLTPGNGIRRARRNVAHHYDLDERFYRLWLDEDLQYSCAYFDLPTASLDEAQRAKKRHIAAKLLIERGHRILDIGCGWGGLALYLADIAGAENVKGITLSEEQLAVARERAEEQGLAHRVSFELEDYRQTPGIFDRIVSVGMFEHVGAPSYRTYFEQCRTLLADDGIMLLHTIGRSGRPWPTNPWIRRYIFPGGYLPALSEVSKAIEKAGLIVTDIEVLRLHYAKTLRAWRERFLAHRDEAARLFDERFCRMWEFYLAASEATFRFEDTVVFQIQIAKRNDVVPLTRGYIAEAENRLRKSEAERGQRPQRRLAAE